MSYCQLIYFTHNNIIGHQDFQNAWGGAAYIWTCLYNQYLKDPYKPHDSWILGNTKALWDLAKGHTLSPFERATHVSTFDYALVTQPNFTRYAEHLRDFVHHYGTQGQVCHLPSWARAIEKCKADAVGFRHTSVSPNYWYDHDPCTEEYVPYDFNERTDHFEVYAWLENH